MLGIVAKFFVPTVSARLTLGFVESETLEVVGIVAEVKNGQLIGGNVNGRALSRAGLSDPYFELELTSMNEFVWIADFGIILEYLGKSAKPARQNPRTSLLVEFMRQRGPLLRIDGRTAAKTCHQSFHVFACV